MMWAPMDLLSMGCNIVLEVGCGGGGGGGGETMMAEHSQVLPDNGQVAALSILHGDDDDYQEVVQHKLMFESKVRAFLLKEGGEGVKQQKVERTTTYWTLMALNSALARCTTQGLEQFSYSPGADQQQQHRSVVHGAFPPSLFAATDQATVCLSSMCYARYQLRLMAEHIPDPSHRAHNDLSDALKATRPFWDVILLLGIPANVNYGPWQGAGFWRQVQETTENRLRDAQDPMLDPLYASLLPRILHDKGDPPECLGSTEWLHETWSELGGSVLSSSKGPKLALCRWMSALECITYWDKFFHQRVFLLMVWGLTMDYVSADPASTKIVLSKLRKPEAGAEKKETMRESNLKSQIQSMRSRPRTACTWHCWS
jgi:hypothetical protein